MGSRSRPRHKASFCAAFALAVLPVVLTTSEVVVSPSAVVKPAARAALATAGDLVVPSRSATRFSPLENTEPQLAVVAASISREAPDTVEVSGPKGTRVWTASAMSDHNVPLAAERAYRNAARTMGSTDPACQLPWTLLAGIGRVESDHGRYGGSTLGNDGVSRPHIIGVQLNGAGPVAAIRDTDNGRLDGDKVWDRAVGPMQFIPSTWAFAGRDGDGDGVESPNDLDDAALAAAAYLCSGSGSVLGESGMSAAIYRYNQDDYYVALVMAFERGYRTGVFVMPPPPVVEEDEPTKRKKKRTEKKRDRQGGDRPRDTSSGPGTGGGPAGDQPADRPTSKPSPKPPSKPSGDDDDPSKPADEPTGGGTTKPQPTPTPPEPTGPQLTSVGGVWTACGSASGWCLGSTALDLGPFSPSDAAAGDFDRDGSSETNGEEFSALAGRQVTLMVESTSGGAVVYVINGIDYRFADGSLA